MYLQFFGLRKNPFTTVPDPSFFYEAPDHREAIAALQHGIDNDKGCMVVTGEVGTGKTTLAHFLVNSLTESVIAVYIDYPFDSLMGLIKILADRIDVDLSSCNNAVEMATRIKERLASLASEGKKVVIIIDEAQNLSSESLEYVRLISNIHIENKRVLNIVLIGQNELGNKIKSEQLKPLLQRITIWKTLRPLSLDETENYIRHRILLAGSYEMPFTKGALKLIYKRTGGIPRLINLLCDNLLLLGYAENRRKISAKLVRKITKEELRHAGTRKEKTLGRKLLASTLVGIVLLSALIFLKKESPSQRSVNDGAPYLAKADEMLAPFQTFDIKADEIFRLDPFEIGALQGYSTEPTERSQPTPAVYSQDNTPEMVKQISVAGNIAKLTAKAEQIQVHPGDYLLKLAKQHYGKVNATILDFILCANPSLKDINFIRAGQKLVFPPISEETLILKNTEGEFLIHLFSSFTIEGSQDIMLKLRGLNYPTFLDSLSTAGVTFYRVYVGPFDSYEVAVMAFKKLPKEHLPLSR